MKYDNNSLMEEFHNTYIKERYPEISMVQTKEICRGPWAYFRDAMESGNFITVRLKYFGTFVVYPKSAILKLNKLRKKFVEQRIYPQKFFKKRDAVLNMLRYECDIR